ncbi:hypothetical protein N9L68_03000 [bacterium]|nr:hypothetical protein [bacterium]
MVVSGPDVHASLRVRSLYSATGGAEAAAAIHAAWLQERTEVCPSSRGGNQCSSTDAANGPAVSRPADALGVWTGVWAS